MKNTTKVPPLHLTNSMGDRKQPFASRQKGTVKLFTCGPSIYASPHIGNYRSFLYEDILHRYLEYSGYAVQRLLNFTDVEDKSIKKAGGKKQALLEITEDAAENFHKNCGLLHIKVPDFIPRSSTSVDQAVQLVTTLLAKRVAYRFGSDIFYDPQRFEGFGRLFGLDMSDWPHKRRRYHKDNYSGNRWNRGDFILWHGYRPAGDGDIFWETELGPGRPAWNVQDPAMITKHLGFRIDIACGGVDNLYRHHDYTIAVIEAASGEEFAPFWLHGEHVLLNGKKISKSKGNLIYPSDLMTKNMNAAAIRFALITVHYRRKLDLNDSFLAQQAEKCSRLRSLARQCTAPLPDSGTETAEAGEHIENLTTDFEKAMNDDLQVATACDSLDFHLEALAGLRAGDRVGKEQWSRIQEKLLRIDSVLQVLFE